MKDSAQQRIPDPALVVLAGAAGSGKSTWAGVRYRSVEVVSSDALRSVVGSGPADLDATADAFDLLNRIVTARVGRGLTTVIDTLGLDAGLRRAYVSTARRAGLPAVLVIMDTPPELCRRRNAGRDRPVPASVLTDQLRKARALRDAIAEEGWDLVVRIQQDDADPVPPPLPAAVPLTTGVRVVLQVSRFPRGDEPGPWLRDMAVAADRIGLDGLALMDHLIQIPQVGRPWEPIPEPWVTLGFLAGVQTRLRLGTLVSPVTFRAPGIIAKTAATLDVLSGGRAFCGLGAGWWAREHAAYGLAFPPIDQRFDLLASSIPTLRALWAPGTKAYAGSGVELPETTGYPRPLSRIPIIVGGSGERRTLRIVAELADGCNIPSDIERLPHRLDVLRRHCDEVGRDPDEVEITVLDVPVVGVDRDDVARRVERLRGRTPAAAFAVRRRVGTASDLAQRWRQLGDLGVRTIFCALPDLTGADDLERLAPALQALREAS